MTSSSPTPTLSVHPVPAMGAEDVVVVPSGRHEGSVYTGTEEGSIWRLSHDGRRVEQVARTGGRPLGLELFDDGDLLVCDARRGLLVVRPDSGEVEELVTEVGGEPMRFCNNAAIAPDGTIWFTDSSRHHGIEEWKEDFVRNTCTGRLLRRGPDGRIGVALDGLAFANGAALSASGDYVAVAETGARTVVRHWVSGPREGTRDYLVQGLPGYPDNIARGSDGLIWVALASPTDAVVERLHGAPAPLRRVATLVPERIQPKPRRTVRAQAYDDRGTLVHDLDVSTPDFHMVTGVREHDGRVWLGSLHEPAVAVVDR